MRQLPGWPAAAASYNHFQGQRAAAARLISLAIRLSPTKCPTPIIRRFILQGIEHFNVCDFYESHEVWEDLWADYQGPARKFYQGLIQVAVALHHFGNGNIRGARKLFLTAATLSRSLSPPGTGARPGKISGRVPALLRRRDGQPGGISPDRHRSRVDSRNPSGTAVRRLRFRRADVCVAMLARMSTPVRTRARELASRLDLFERAG